MDLEEKIKILKEATNNRQVIKFKYNNNDPQSQNSERTAEPLFLGKPLNTTNDLLLIFQTSGYSKSNSDLSRCGTYKINNITKLEILDEDFVKESRSKEQWGKGGYNPEKPFGNTKLISDSLHPPILSSSDTITYYNDPDQGKLVEPIKTDDTDDI